MAQNKVRERRVDQLKQAKRAIAKLGKALQDVRRKQRREDELASHLEGFYEEISKLVKGRTLVEVTDLVVEQANDIIKDSKSIVEDDTYLDRLKKFVPAGNNPSYPDVLMVIRTVRQSLERSQARTEQRRERLSSLLLEAETIHGALTCYVHYKIDSPEKEHVERVVDGNVTQRWFPGTFSTGFHFDFGRLDSNDLDSYFSEDDEDDVPEDGQHDEEESADDELEDEETEE